MNRKTFLWIFFLSSYFQLTGCVYDKPYGAVLGAFYTEMGGIVSPNLYLPSYVEETKRGEDCGTVIIIPLQRATVLDAARAGGIQKVLFVDYRIRNVLGVFIEYCIIAYGK